MNFPPSIPTRLALFERLTLPSADPGELLDMVRLQFEKTLPWPPEEVSCGLQTLSPSASAGESPPQPPRATLLAGAVSHQALEAFFPAPQRAGLPPILTLRAMQAAAAAPENTTVCALWREDDGGAGDDLVFAIFENRRLGFAEILERGADIAQPKSLLSPALLRAEMSGAPVEFAALLLDPALQNHAAALADFFRVPVRELRLEAAAPLSKNLSNQGAEPLPEALPDFTPAPWLTLREQAATLRRRLRQAAFVGIAYVFLLLAAVVFLHVQERELLALSRQAAALQPPMDALLERQARWRVLAPAVDSRHFAVERILQIWECLPTPETRITRLDLGPGQCLIEGEAPTAALAIAFAEKLKTHPALGDLRFEAPQPVILPNDTAQFRIFGK